MFGIDVNTIHEITVSDSDSDSSQQNGIRTIDKMYGGKDRNAVCAVSMADRNCKNESILRKRNFASKFQDISMTFNGVPVIDTLREIKINDTDTFAENIDTFCDISKTDTICDIPIRDRFDGGNYIKKTDTIRDNTKKIDILCSLSTGDITEINTIHDANIFDNVFGYREIDALHDVTKSDAICNTTTSDTVGDIAKIDSTRSIPKQEFICDIAKNDKLIRDVTASESIRDIKEYLRSICDIPKNTSVCEETVTDDASEKTCVCGVCSNYSASMFLNSEEAKILKIILPVLCDARAHSGKQCTKYCLRNFLSDAKIKLKKNRSNRIAKISYDTSDGKSGACVENKGEGKNANVENRREEKNANVENQREEKNANVENQREEKNANVENQREEKNCENKIDEKICSIDENANEEELYKKKLNDIAKKLMSKKTQCACGFNCIRSKDFLRHPCSLKETKNLIKRRQKSYRCRKCKVKYATREKLDDHAKKHSEKDSVCDKCELSFYSERKFSNHREKCLNRIKNDPNEEERNSKKIENNIEGADISSKKERIDGAPTISKHAPNNFTKEKKFSLGALLLHSTKETESKSQKLNTRENANKSEIRKLNAPENANESKIRVLNFAPENANESTKDELENLSESTRRDTLNSESDDASANAGNSAKRRKVRRVYSSEADVESSDPDYAPAKTKKKKRKRLKHRRRSSSDLDDRAKINTTPKKVTSNAAMLEDRKLAIDRKDDLEAHKQLSEKVQEMCKGGYTKCDVCDISFDKVTSFKSHMYQFHLRKKAFRCPLCGDKYILRSELQKHLADAHPRDAPNRCLYCEQKDVVKVFVTDWDLKLHLKTHQNKGVSVGDYYNKDKEFVAYSPKNKRQNGTPNSVAKSKRKRPKKTPNAVVKSEAKRSNKTPNAVAKSETKCPNKTPNAVVKSEGPEPQFACFLCDFKDVAKCGLEYHLGMEHFDDADPACDFCGATFLYTEDVEEHIRLKACVEKDGDYGFPCVFCVMVFEEKSQLREHHRAMHYD